MKQAKIILASRWHPNKNWHSTRNSRNWASSQNTVAQLAGAVEYTDCFSAEGLDPTPTVFIKMNLSLYNLQKLICHKSQTANQPTEYSWFPYPEKNQTILYSQQERL